MRHQLLLCFLAVLPAFAATSFCSDEGFAPVWSDEFDYNELDKTKWNAVNGTDIGSCREAFCSPQNVYVADGQLHLVSKREMLHGRNYSTGAVNSKSKAAWWPNSTFRLCVSARLPGIAGLLTKASQGLWPAHWMMPTTPSCDPDLGEMDILEMVNGNGLAHSTYHWETTYPKEPCAYPKGHESITNEVFLGENWNETFHEFAVERGENHLYFAVDGKIIVNSSSVGNTVDFWNVPFYVILNTAIGGTWPGNPTPETVFPVTHSIDYVRVSEKKSTPPPTPEPTCPAGAFWCAQAGFCCSTICCLDYMDQWMCCPIGFSCDPGVGCQRD